MKNRYLAYGFVIALAGFHAGDAKGQQALKVGSNPTIVTPSAVLDVEASNKGVLMPRVALTGTTDVTTIANPANALTVFNTATAGTAPDNVIPGYYFYSTSLNKWVKLITTEEVKPDYKIQFNPTSYNHFTSDAGLDGLGQTLGGSANIAIGLRSMSNSTFNGTGNTAMGYGAARSLTSGINNVAIGASSGLKLTTGLYNVMVGTEAMDNLETGFGNTVLGSSAMGVAILNSNYNTTVGGETLVRMESGDDNIAVGYLAGGHLITGNGNIYLGKQAGNPIPLAGVNESNQLYINNGPGANALIRGDFATKELTINNNLTVTGLNSTATATTGNRPVVADANGQLMIGAAVSSGWGLTGNAGTSPSTNFLGTLDNVSLKLKSNDQLSAYLSSGGANTSFGYKAGLNFYEWPTGADEVIGRTSGPGRRAKGITAIGYKALGEAVTSTTAYPLAATTAIGAFAMAKHQGSSTSYETTAVGYGAAYNQLEGAYNVIMGAYAASGHTSLFNNVIIGSRIFDDVSSVTKPAVLGTLQNNIYIGNYSGGTSGDYRNNMVFGSYQPTGSYSNQFKVASPDSSTPFVLLDGDFSTKKLIVNNTLQVTDLASTATATTGNRPVVADANGQLMIGVAGGSDYSVITSPSGTNHITKDGGVGGLGLSLPGDDNYAVGRETLKSITNGSYNLAFGTQALTALQNGNNNVALGQLGLYNLLSGSNNLATSFAGTTLENGSENIFIGPGSGNYLVGGNRNIYIGLTGFSTPTTTNDKLYIHNAYAVAPLIYGDFAARNLTINGSSSPTTSSPSNTSTLNVNGSIGASITSITGDYTIKDDDHTIIVRPTVDGDITLTLPSASLNKGRIYYIKSFNQNSGILTIDALMWPNQIGPYQDNISTIKIMVQSDGTNWMVIQ